MAAASTQTPTLTEVAPLSANGTKLPTSPQTAVNENGKIATSDSDAEAHRSEHENGSSAKAVNKDAEDDTEDDVETRDDDNTKDNVETKDDIETKDDVETKDPKLPATGSLQASYERRDNIIQEIRRKTGVEFSFAAIDGFLDTAHAIDLILKSIAHEGPLAEQPDDSDNNSDDGSEAPRPRQIAKPEIKCMTWEEWRKTGKRRYDGTREDHSAIEVLCEEPLPKWAAGRSSFTKGSRAGDVAESRPSMHNKEDGPLPPRIRINSVPARRILDSLCNDELAFSEDDPLIIFRPYKLLVHKKADINRRMAELELLYTERLNKKEAQKHSADQMLKADEEVDGTSCNDEGHSKANIKSNDENDEESAEFLAKRKFPNDMIFSTDTDWSTLTLSEIKEAVDDFRCLVRFMNETLQPVRTHAQSLPPTVHFSNLWHLFPIGCLIYCRQSSTPQKIWRVLRATGGRRYMSRPVDSAASWDRRYSDFLIDCYYLDFDGTVFNRIYHRFKIEMFEKPMSVEALPIMPLADAEKRLPGVDREVFRERGQQFLTYTKPQHRFYQGTTVTQSARGEPLFRQDEDSATSHRLFTERVESQVVIDFERGIQANPGWGAVYEDADCYQIEAAELQDGMEFAEKDSVWDAKTGDDHLAQENIKELKWSQGEAMPEGDDLLLLPERVLGYVLRTRSWACLRLSAGHSGGDRLTPVDRSETSWKDLEIPTGHKSVIQALISTHFSKGRNKDAQFDLIREKGKGVIILLHGVPGVGKTATAECVAASYGKPLLPITCGDLGLKPKEVEATLHTAFQLAQAWDGVMLLDEADIFLAQRTNQDIERNALVSVFLRILEYYEGVLFLTTNRVGVFDEAFKSRIHMALYYPPLDWLTSEKIWRNLIRRTRESPMRVECSPDALIKFAWELFEEQNKSTSSIGPAWNGRQIRNAFQSAIALAHDENIAPNASVMVESRHFKTVADVSNEFNNYIWRVKSGRTDADYAKEVQSRYDDFSRTSFAQGPSQSQQQQFPPPSQSSMPMRQTTPNINPFQGLHTPQSVYQQPTYVTATGSPYNPNQSALYSNAQPPLQPPLQSPPQFNLAPGYGTQQPQYAQHLQAPAGQQYQTPQVPAGQQFQTSQIPAGQQFQSFQTPLAQQQQQQQQQQIAQPQAGYAPQNQPSTHSSYIPPGAVEQTIPSHEGRLDHPRA